MDELQALIGEVHDAFRALGLNSIEKHFVLALLVAVVFYVGVWVIERSSGTRGDEYGSRDFAYDMVYWCYYRSGLNYFLIIAVLYPTLDQPIAWLDLGLLTPYPIAVQALVFFFVSDLYGYWMHRAMHRFKFLWAFHSMHHAPERITFAASARFHPVEIAVVYAGFYLLVRISGSNPLAWLPVTVFMEITLQAQHTRIPWTLGPLYKVFVTPAFHWFHHSKDPAHYDKNFGAVLSLWDHLFGTALPQRAPVPRELGLAGIKHDTLWSTLAMPFRAAAALLRRKPAAVMEIPERP